MKKSTEINTDGLQQLLDAGLSRNEAIATLYAMNRIRADTISNGYNPNLVIKVHRKQGGDSNE